MRTSTAALSLVLLLGMVPFANGQQTTLSYAPQSGSSWTTELKLMGKPPMGSVQVVKVDYTLSCTSQQGDLFQMSAHMPATQMPDGTVVGPLSANFSLAGDGSVSSLTSPHLDNPGTAAYVRSVALLFPRIPGGSVSPEDEWTWRFTIHNPNPSKGMPDKVRVFGRFKFEGVEDGLATIAVRLVEVQGEPVKVEMSGKLLVTTENGRPASGVVTGKVKIKKGFFWVSMPVRLSLERLDG